MKKKKIKACYCYAYWCNASVKLKETFVEVCNDLGMKWEIINVEAVDGVDFSIKYGVRNVPAIVVLEDGKEVEKYKGNSCCLDMLNEKSV